MSKGSMSIYVENRGAHQARSMPRDAWLLQTACILSCKQSGVHLSLPWGTVEETEARQYTTLAQGAQQGRLQVSPKPWSCIPSQVSRALGHTSSHLSSRQRGLPHFSTIGRTLPPGSFNRLLCLPSSCISPVSFDRTSCEGKVTMRGVSGG